MTELARTHVIVDEEGVMLDVVTGVEPPYVVLLATHAPDGRPGAVFGLDAPTAQRLAERLLAAADDPACGACNVPRSRHADEPHEWRARP